MSFLDLAGDSLDGALSRTCRASNALVGCDGVRQQVLTHMRRALLFVDVSAILVFVEPDGRKNRIGSRLSKSAQRRIYDDFGQPGQLLDVTVLTLAITDLSIIWYIGESPRDTACTSRTIRRP